jgi:hypothetical protein
VADDRMTEAWTALWRSLDALQDDAGKLRHLSQEEPLLKSRPDYPRARIGRSHADEVRDVLDDMSRRLEEMRTLIPQALPLWAAESSEARPPGVADEAPQVVLARIHTLGRIAASLTQEAFLPPPPLPPHAPPYLSEPPGHDLPGTKAILLSGGIENVVTVLRNLLLRAANTSGV